MATKTKPRAEDPTVALALTSAMAMEPYVRDLILAALDDAATSVRIREVQLAMRSKKNADAFSKGVSRSADGLLRPRLNEALRTVVSQAVSTAVPADPSALSPGEARRVGISKARPKRPVRLLTVIEQASEYAGRFSASHLTNASKETQLAVRNAVTQGMLAGKTPQAIAASLRDQIGLTAVQQTAVMNYERTLKAAGNLPAGQVKAAVTTYSTSLRRHRANVIARTEVMFALNAGRVQTWKAYQERGVIPATAMKVWVTAEDERMCGVCEPMHDVSVPLAEDFSIETKPGTFITMPQPPPHPQCRCIMRLVE